MFQSIPFGEVGIELRRCKIGSFPNPFRFKSRWVKGFSLLSGCPFLVQTCCRFSTGHITGQCIQRLLRNMPVLKLSNWLLCWPIWTSPKAVAFGQFLIGTQVALSHSREGCRTCLFARSGTIVTVTNCGHGQQSLQLGSGCQRLSLSLRCSWILFFTAEVAEEATWSDLKKLPGGSGDLRDKAAVSSSIAEPPTIYLPKKLRARTRCTVGPMEDPWKTHEKPLETERFCSTEALNSGFWSWKVPREAWAAMGKSEAFLSWLLLLCRVGLVQFTLHSLVVHDIPRSEQAALG